jgi:hypothetical protein
LDNNRDSRLRTARRIFHDAVTALAAPVPSLVVDLPLVPFPGCWYRPLVDADVDQLRLIQLKTHIDGAVVVGRRELRTAVPVEALSGWFRSPPVPGGLVAAAATRIAVSPGRPTAPVMRTQPGMSAV